VWGDWAWGTLGVENCGGEISNGGRVDLCFLPLAVEHS